LHGDERCGDELHGDERCGDERCGDERANLGVILSVTFLGRARKVTSSAAGDVE